MYHLLTPTSKNTIPINLLADLCGICAICLRTTKKLSKIDGGVLSAYHKKLTNYLLQSSSTFYCIECEYLLRKTYKFHQKCLKAAEILKAWVTSEIQRTTTQGIINISVDMLHKTLPQTNLAPWTPKNNAAFYIRCLRPDSVDTSIVIDNENLSDSNGIPVAPEICPQNYERDSDDIKTNTPLIVLNAGLSEKNDTVNNKNTGNKSNDMKQTSIRTHESSKPVPDNTILNFNMPILAQTKSLAKPKVKPDAPLPGASLHIEKTIHAEEVKDDVNIVWLKDDKQLEQKLTGIEENSCPNDVSLTNDDDCEIINEENTLPEDNISPSNVDDFDDYLYEPQLANNNINEGDLADNALSDVDLTDINLREGNFGDYATANASIESANGASNKIVTVQNNVDSMSEKIIKKITPNIVLNAGLYKKTNTVKNKNTENKSSDIKQTSKRTYEATKPMPDVKYILKKKDNNTILNFNMPLLSQTKSFAKPKAKQNVPDDSLNIESVNKTIQAEEVKDDVNIVWLRDDKQLEQNLTKIEENSCPDDVSLTNDDDCEIINEANTLPEDNISLSNDDDFDDYLYEPPKKQKRPALEQLPKNDINQGDIVGKNLNKETLIVIARSDTDLININLLKKKIDDYATANASIKTANTVIKNNVTLENKVDSMMEKIIKDLDSICGNWEISNLTHLEHEHVSKEDILAFIRTFLTDREVANKLCSERFAKFKKMGVHAKLMNIASNLDLVTETCVDIVKGDTMELNSVKNRVKAELTARVEKYGELRGNHDVVFDIKHIVNLLDLAPSKRLRQVLKNLYECKSRRRLSGIASHDLKLIMKKGKLEKYMSIFDIQYLRSEKEAIEEFEQRKNYPCYVTAKFKCEICFLPFLFEGLFKYHMRFHTEEPGPWRCSLCKLDFISQIRMEKHKLTHEIVYKCKLCPLVTYYEGSMMHHSECHKNTVHKCNICHAVFKKKTAMYDHRKRGHGRNGRPCAICGGVFYSEAGLKWHIFRTHSNASGPRCEGVPCEWCEVTFVSPQAYYRHTITMHRTKPARAPRTYRPQQTPNRVRKKTTTTCVLCNKVGANFTWLIGHFAEQHPGVDARAAYVGTYLLLCHVCGKGFQSMKSYQTHRSTWHSAAEYTCPECGKHCPSGASLRNHRYTHGPRTFACKLCGKKFRSPSNLYNHMPSHSTDRRYKCSICGKGFLSRNAINEHVRGVHEGIPRVRKGGGKRLKRSRSIEPDADCSGRRNESKQGE